MWRTIPMGAMLVDTGLNAVCLMVGQLLRSLLAAYGFARWRFPSDAALFLLFVGTWLAPLQVTMLPNYIVLSGLGWLDSLPALVFPHLGAAPSASCCFDNS